MHSYDYEEKTLQLAMNNSRHLVTHAQTMSTFLDCPYSPPNMAESVRLSESASQIKTLVSSKDPAARVDGLLVKGTSMVVFCDSGPD